MARLILARHGESEANVQNVFFNRPGKHDVTDLGRAQAITLAERLAAFGAWKLGTREWRADRLVARRDDRRPDTKQTKRPAFEENRARVAGSSACEAPT